jgi:hypothetical protein
VEEVEEGVAADELERVRQETNESATSDGVQGQALIAPAMKSGASEGVQGGRKSATADSPTR